MLPSTHTPGHSWKRPQFPKHSETCAAFQRLLSRTLMRTNWCTKTGTARIVSRTGRGAACRATSPQVPPLDALKGCCIRDPSWRTDKRRIGTSPERKDGMKHRTGDIKTAGPLAADPLLGPYGVRFVQQSRRPFPNL